MSSLLPRRLPSALIAGALAAPTLLAQSPVHSWSGEQLDDLAGTVVAHVGDVDGDGIGDVAVGAPRGGSLNGEPQAVFEPDIGVVWVHSGDDGSPLHRWVGAAGQVTEFGAALAGAGDVDGDGHADVLVGAPRQDTLFGLDAGAVHLFSGATGQVMRTWNGQQQDALFGQALAVGDMDGDGALDVAVGMPHFDFGQLTGSSGGVGRVRIYDLASAALIDDQVGQFLLSISLFVPHVDVKGFGAALAFEPPASGSGAGTLLVGAPTSDVDLWPNALAVAGGAVVRLAAGTGVHELVEAGRESGDEYGSALAVLGDVPGGCVIGAPGEGEGGAVHALRPNQPDTVVTGFATLPLGDVVAAADVDGDGQDDLIAGSPLADAVVRSASDRGRVVAHDVVSGDRLLDLHGEDAFDLFGAAVAAGPLTDGGPLALLIGAPGVDGPSFSSGEAALFVLDCLAGSALYGAGLPGTIGTPQLFMITEAVLGTTATVRLVSSAPSTTQAWLLVGPAATSLPFKGGQLLVADFNLTTFPLPSAGMQLPLAVPDQAALCGVHLFAQLALQDAGAVQGVSLSQGLDLWMGL